MKNPSPRVPNVEKTHSLSRRRFLVQTLIGVTGFTFADALSPLLKIHATNQSVSRAETGSIPTSNDLISSSVYTAYPSSKGTFPAVLVIHDWHGVTTTIKQTADRLAAMGFVAMVPDLFEGKVVHSPAEARDLMQNFDVRRGLAILQNAINRAANDAAVSGSKVGIITSEFNSRYAVALGQQSLQVGGVLVFNDARDVDQAADSMLSTLHTLDYPICTGTAKPIDGQSVRDWAPMLVLNDPQEFDRGVRWLRQTVIA